MTEAKRPPEHEHPLAKRLRQAGITKVAIIDDAYDAPTVDIFYGGEIDDFWGKIERDPDMLKELQGFKNDIQDSEDIDDEVINMLWNTRKNLKKLSEPCNKKLFVNRLQMLNDIDAISEHLRTLGLEPIPIGSEDELPEPSIKLVFLDYVLDPIAKENLGEIATRKAKEIYSRVGKDAEKPFIVLMSDKIDDRAQQEAFRKDSKLLGGLFGFRAKKDLLELDRLYIDLTTWSIDMPARHSIQRFVEALEKSLNQASNEFIERVKELSFEDYANIQSLSLQPDGQPLGEYMLWLYKSYLLHLIHNREEILDQQKKIDGLSFTKYYPSQNLPSARLAEIYRCALTEPGVGKLEVHPLTNEDENEPYMQFGDIFAKKGSLEVLVVINAACDLTYAPGTRRAFPKERSILLEHGTMQTLTEISQANMCRTELFEHEGESYRIVWDHKRVISKEYGEVWQWLKDGEYERIARLKLPYALEVQRFFATNLTRIGMPVKPPFYESADVEVYCEGSDGTCMMLGDTIKGGAFVAHCKSGEEKYLQQFSISGDCILEVKKRLEKAIEALEEQGEFIKTQAEPKPGKGEAYKKKDEKVLQGRLGGIKTKIEKIRQLQELDKVFLPMLRKVFDLPKTNKPAEIDEKLLWIYDEKEFKDKYFPHAPIALNIKRN